jgi:phage/plasmid-like protein (TIGR03299 family)
MAHELESGFFVGTPAWHGLGEVLKDAPSIEEGIVKAGLNWRVVEKPLFIDMAQGMEDDMPPAGLVRGSDWKAIVRESDESILGVVGKNYLPVQNVEAFQWFDFLLDDGSAKLEAAGSLRDGKRVWVLAKLQAKGAVVPGDEVESYLLLSNSFDGATSLWITFTPVRVVCMNTLTAALQGRYKAEKVGRALKFRHTAGVKDQMAYAKELVDAANEHFEGSLDSFRMMAKKRMDDAAYERYIAEVLGDDEPKGIRAWGYLRESFEAGPGANLPGVRGTVWAGFNSVTDWIDHGRGRSEETRLDGAWYGVGSRLRQKAFSAAMSLVEA